MDLKLQKKLATKVTKTSKKRVKISPEAQEQVKQAITKADIISLVKEGVINVFSKRGTSRHRARARHLAKKKGRQRGTASKKGKKTARTPRKEQWIKKVRLQRRVLKDLKDKNQVNQKDYRQLYLKIKGGFFRSKKHLLLYMNQHNLIIKKETPIKKKEIKK